VVLEANLCSCNQIRPNMFLKSASMKPAIIGQPM
jgi:hypothetical protein